MVTMQTMYGKLQLCSMTSQRQQLQTSRLQGTPCIALSTRHEHQCHAWHGRHRCTLMACIHAEMTVGQILRKRQADLASPSCYHWRGRAGDHRSCHTTPPPGSTHPQGGRRTAAAPQSQEQRSWESRSAPSASSPASCLLPGQSL